MSNPGVQSGESINSRMDRLQLESIMFYHCMSRLMNILVTLQRKFMDKNTMIRKEDLKSAYRRLHLRAGSVMQSGVKVKINGKWYIIISLRITFGDASGPVGFCLFSDIVFIVINDLLACKSWNQKEVCSEFVKYIPPAEEMDSSIPFGQASELSVEIPVEANGKFDVCIDDFIGIAVDIHDTKSRLELVPPYTVLHAISNSSENKNHIP